jgi:hypothetical protein
VYRLPRGDELLQLRLRVGLSLLERQLLFIEAARAPPALLRDVVVLRLLLPEPLLCVRVRDGRADLPLLQLLLLGAPVRSLLLAQLYLSSELQQPLLLKFHELCESFLG